MNNNNGNDNTVSVPVLGDTPMVAAIIVLATLGVLIAINRGFRGITLQ